MTDKAKEAKEAEEKEAHVDLIVMTKDDAKLKVHPSCVAAHQQKGWKEAETD